jgi:hypothetical protein
MKYRVIGATVGTIGVALFGFAVWCGLDGDTRLLTQLAMPCGVTIGLGYTMACLGDL